MPSVHDNSEKITNMVIHDLRLFNVELINGNVHIANSPVGKLSEFVSSSKNSMKELAKELHSLWNSIPLFLAEDSGIISDSGRRLMISAIDNLSKKISNNPTLMSMSVLSSLQKASMEYHEKWSDKTAEDMCFVLIKIDSIEHKIRKIAFIVSGLMYLNEEIKKVAQTSGTSVQGPYSNLDLPMPERWYLWGDVSDEVEGRRDSIRSSRRYQMGLEDADPLSVKEGYYWRELRNEPYKFDVLYPDSPYPYRSAIWGNP